MIFIFMSSIAFAISGVLEKLSESYRNESTAALEMNRSEVDLGRRYCDPPNVTAFAIYYESNDEVHVDDFDLLQNQITSIQVGRFGFSSSKIVTCLFTETSESGVNLWYFPSYFLNEITTTAINGIHKNHANNMTEPDREMQVGDIFFNLGFIASFAPACLITSKGGPDKMFLYGISVGVLLKVVFIEASIPAQINGATSGFILGVVMFSFYNMCFRFVTSGRNSLISFASVRHTGLAIGELLIAFAGNKRYVLYIILIISVFWFVIWLRLEFGFCSSDRENERNETICSTPPIPWKNVLGSRPIWMTVAAVFGASSGMSSIFIGMRLNLKYIYYVPVEILSAISGLLHTGFAVACGVFIDYLTEAQIVSVTTSRRMIVYVSHFIPSGFLFVLGFLGCEPTTPMIFYCLTVMTTGANYTGAFSSPLDLAPKYLGVVLAFCFTFGSLGSLIMSYLIFYILTHQVFVSWRFIFSLNSLILLLTAIFFMLRGSGSVQQWNDSNHKVTKGTTNNSIEQGRISVTAPPIKQRTKSIYLVEKKILKVLHVQEPDKFTRIRAYSTSLPNERSAANTHIYRPSNKKRASIS